MTDIEKHVPPGFHHDKKPKGVGIATDIVRHPFLIHKPMLMYTHRMMVLRMLMICLPRAKKVRYPHHQCQMESPMCPMATCNKTKALGSLPRLAGRPGSVKEASHPRKPKRVFSTIKRFWRASWTISSLVVRFPASCADGVVFSRGIG